MSTTAQAVEQFLSKIDQTKDLNIFLEVWADEARTQAAQVDETSHRVVRVLCPTGSYTSKLGAWKICLIGRV